MHARSTSVVALLQFEKSPIICRWGGSEKRAPCAHGWGWAEKSGCVILSRTKSERWGNHGSGAQSKRHTGRMAIRDICSQLWLLNYIQSKNRKKNAIISATVASNKNRILEGRYLIWQTVGNFSIRSFIKFYHNRLGWD